MAKCRVVIGFLFFLFFITFTNFLCISPAYADPPILSSITLSDTDSGSTEYTNSEFVVVDIDCAGSPAEMMLSYRSDFEGASWIAYENPTIGELNRGYVPGNRTLYCKLRNALLEESNIVSDSIFYDRYPPGVYDNATVIDNTHVDIRFTKPELIGADDPENYSIDNNLEVSESVYVGEYRWRLTTSSQTEEVVYTILVSQDVTDLAGNPVELGNDTAIFTGMGGPPYLEVGGPNPDYSTIAEAMAVATNGATIHVYPGVYNENVHMKENVILEGDDNVATIIKGNVFFEEVDATIDNFTILFQEGSILSFTNNYYANWALLADAGITAINSKPVIQKCIIKPDPDMIDAEYYGKAIQIWNMYNNSEVSPQVEFNLIQNTNAGIYYFSQAFGGAINGEIKNNTFYHNKNGIILRMHKENPHIYNNILDSCQTAGISFTYYEDEPLFSQRKINVNNNLFHQNTSNFSPFFDLTNGNFEDNPLFVNPNNDNFYLQVNSPALTGGVGGSLIGAYVEGVIGELFIEITSCEDGVTIYAEP